MKFYNGTDINEIKTILSPLVPTQIQSRYLLALQIQRVKLALLLLNILTLILDFLIIQNLL